MGLLTEVKKHRIRALKMMVLLPCFFSFGLTLASLGPSLMDLMVQTSTASMSKMTLVMAGRAAGGMAGCVAGKFGYLTIMYII